MKQTSKQILFRMLAEIEKPLEMLKQRLVLAIVLLLLVDIEVLGFSLEASIPFDQQKIYTDVKRQSFLWVHQKLVGMLEPYEILANTDLQVWYEDYGRRDLQISPPQSHRRQAPSPVHHLSQVQAHRSEYEQVRPASISYQIAPITTSFQSDQTRGYSPIVIRSSITAGTHPLTLTGHASNGGAS